MRSTSEDTHNTPSLSLKPRFTSSTRMDFCEESVSEPPQKPRVSTHLQGIRLVRSHNKTVWHDDRWRGVNKEVEEVGAVGQGKVLVVVLGRDARPWDSGRADESRRMGSVTHKIPRLSRGPRPPKLTVTASPKLEPRPPPLWIPSLRSGWIRLDFL